MLTLLSVKDAATRLGVHPDTIRRLIDRGELKAARIGRNVRIEEGELVAYVRRGTNAVPAQPASGPTSGQLRAFHAKADDIDKKLEQPRRTTKVAILAATAGHFGRTIASANDLSEIEMTWALDQLDLELDRIGL